MPIGYITNGVHAPTWTAPLMAALYDQYLGADWKNRVADPAMWAAVDQILDEEWWGHRVLKERLIAHTRFKIKKAREQRGEDRDRIAATETLLDPNSIDNWFCRRFSPYKRGDLILRNADRALKIFGNAERPLQIVFAGKAHPADEGKRIVQPLMEWCQHPALRNRVALIEDYDIYTGTKTGSGCRHLAEQPPSPPRSIWDKWYCQS